MNLLKHTDRLFLQEQPVAHLASADANGAPHVVPICYAVIENTLYFTIDQKPKSGDARHLKRLRNLSENPQAAVVVDRYDSDWTRLGWIMLRGPAEIIDAGEEHNIAQAALISRYPPYRSMQLSTLPVVAIRVEKVTRWGNLRSCQSSG